MEEYRAVGSRCAVDLNALARLVPRERACSILEQWGFRIVRLDVVDIAAWHARRKTSYRVGCRMMEAPEAFDCSSFVKWCYGILGIWLPRRAMQQKRVVKAIPVIDLAAGDLLFTSGNSSYNYYHQDPSTRVSHVGIGTDRDTVLHASVKQKSVIESPLDEFLGTGELRGAGRVIPCGSDLVTLITPATSFRDPIETSDDVWWLIVSSVAKADSP